ncbi:MAG TPA: hypothetical protein VGP63_16270 [Planctomycetaceae bacterium]|jgi:hypothetical protein|nr:hypothetical protein [Planctomycetaceae bacterium]
MRSSTLLAVVICSAVSIGCGQSNPVQTKAPPGFANGVQPVAAAPEEAIIKLETPEDRVIYLRQLGTDKTFEPQKHAEMLETYSKDGNEEVASAAKELLERK